MPKQLHTHLAKVPSHILLTDLEPAFNLAVQNLSEVVTVRGRNGFEAATGVYRKTGLGVVLKPIGPSSTAIAVEELSRIGARVIIEVSSAYAITTALSIGDLILVPSAIKDDGVSKHFLPAEVPASADFDLVEHILNTFKTYNVLPRVGVVWSTDIYYVNSEITEKNRVYHKVALAMDLDTATLYTLSALKNISAASILVVEASQPKGIARGMLLEEVEEVSKTREKFSSSLEKAVRIALEALALHYEKTKSEAAKRRP